MIANSEARGTLTGIAGRLTMAVALAATAGIILTATAAPVRLIGVTREGDTVLIEATEPVAYSVSRPDALTLVVDMRNVSVSDARADIATEGAIAGVRLEQAAAVDGRELARVHVNFAKPSQYTVRSSRNTIRVELKGAALPSAAAAAPKPAAGPTPPRTIPTPSAAAAPAPAVAITQGAAGVKSIEPVAPAPTGAATLIERIKSSKTAAATTVTLVGNGHLAPGGVTESKDRPRRLVLDFPNVKSTAPTQTAIDSPFVSRVRVALNSNQPLVTRVVMEIANSTSYRLERSGDSGRDVAVVFEQARPANTVTMTPAEPLKAPIEAEAPITLQQAMANVAAITKPEPVGEPVDPMLALKTAALAAPAPAVERESPAPAPARPSAPPAIRPAAPTAAPQQAAPPPQAAVQAQAAAPPAQSSPLLARAQTAPVTQPPPPPPQQGRPRGDQPRQYTGDPISLDLDGVDLRAVLRTFADVSGLNMVIDPDVQGTVDIILKDVPWDQALDVVLRGNQLDYSVDGTIVRVSRIKTLEDENKARQSASQALAERQAQAGGLSFETFPLSYAKAAEMAPLLKGSLRLSKYGQVQVDVRTNTLIIADLPDQFPAIRQLLMTLDRAEPQVEVEARIVQTTRDFAKAIGVQWGLNGRVMPDVGNTTGLAFPNRGTLGGRLGSQGPTDPRSTDLEQTGTGIALGVPDASTAIGLALGAVNGAFNLDVALSALERSGKGRVLSTPRLTTQNNIEAEVAQGVQIPIQTVANETVTVTFKDAVLTLRVTPQITAANTVIMKIVIENATADFSRQVNGIPPVNTQRANTQVQINDGATTVIGGIFVSTETTSIGQTPLLHRIPILGWLFKNERVEDESRELLIFITPRILKG
jgi:type IV pilus assembly protein PilQ